MPCDICSSPDSTSVIPPDTMSRAVKKGFNPFTLGMIPPSLARLATPDYPAKWSRQAICGILSRSEWTICSTCLPKLTPYLDSTPWWKQHGPMHIIGKIAARFAPTHRP